MLVVFGPKEAGEEYIHKKIAPSANQWSEEGPEIFKTNGYIAAFWGSKPAAEVILKKYGWFLGYACWDDLPPGHSEDSKDLLDVSLDLWRLEGIGFLKRLNGSFNIFLHDEVSGKSLISTDRFGTYGLWIAELEGGWVGLSPCYEHLIPLVQKDIDMAAVWSFATRSRVVGIHTLLERIRGIEGNTAICFDSSSVPSIIQWHNPRFTPETGRSLSSWCAELNHNLGEVIGKNLSGFKSPGLLISGGLDSRLIASLCPPDTRTFTLTDFNNFEMKTAAAAAKICGLKHIKIIRDSDWYPNTLVRSAQRCSCLWRWNHAHFMQLEAFGQEWRKIDCAILGLWFDTLLKGSETPERMWNDAFEMQDMEQTISYLLDVDASQWKAVNQLEEVMRHEIFEECRKAYQQALRAELEQVIPISACAVDAWEMLQFRTLYRKLTYPNIDCLRKMVATRNVILDNKFYDLYFRIPASLRRTGNVVRWALWQRKKILALLPDSNSRIPTFLPKAFHKAANRGQNKISNIRRWWCRRTGSKQHRSHGSWSRFDRLWAHHPQMVTVMDELVQNPTATLEQIFCIDSVDEIWKRHRDGSGNYEELLNVIAGLGLSGI